MSLHPVRKPLCARHRPPQGVNPKPHKRHPIISHEGTKHKGFSFRFKMTIGYSRPFKSISGFLLLRVFVALCEPHSISPFWPRPLRALVMHFRLVLWVSVPFPVQFIPCVNSLPFQNQRKIGRMKAVITINLDEKPRLILILALRTDTLVSKI